MQQWMSLRAYARSRGVSLNAVQKAIESRRVTAIREVGGRITGIDKALADEQWTKNTDPVEAARNGKLEAPAAPSAPSGAEKQPDQVAAPAGDQGDYLAARAKREGFLAKQAELDYLEQIGMLVSSAEVEREFAEIFSQLKNSVMRIADTGAQALAAEADPSRINRMLDEKLRKVFDEFSRRLADATTGGVAGRELALP